MRKRGALAGSLGLYYPWEHWVAEYETMHPYAYHLKRMQEAILCTCCENVHYDVRWNMDAKGLCPVCAAGGCRPEEHRQFVYEQTQAKRRKRNGMETQIVSVETLVREKALIPPINDRLLN